MVKHIDYVSYAFMAWGLFQISIALLIGGMFLVLGGGMGVFGITSGEEELAIIGALYGGIGVFAAAFSALFSGLSFGAYWGLRNRQSWGRLLAFVAGAFAMMSVPHGTMLGIYAFYVLLDSDVAAEFS